jgi:hypothetical protein
MTLDELQERYKEFASINDMNMDSRLLRIPGEKHYWVACLIDAKNQKYKALKAKKKTKESLTKKMIEEGVVSLNKQTLDSLENTESMEKLNDLIHNLDMRIEYLEHCVKNITFIGNDVKNILELRKLQLE